MQGLPASINVENNVLVSEEVIVHIASLYKTKEGRYENFQDWLRHKNRRVGHEAFRVGSLHEGPSNVFENVTVVRQSMAAY